MERSHDQQKYTDGDLGKHVARVPLKGDTISKRNRVYGRPSASLSMGQPIRNKIDPTTGLRRLIIDNYS